MTAKGVAGSFPSPSGTREDREQTETISAAVGAPSGSPMIADGLWDRDFRKRSAYVFYFIEASRTLRAIRTPYRIAHAARMNIHSATRLARASRSGGRAADG